MARALTGLLLAGIALGAALEKRDYYGVATFFYQNGNAGSCGDTHGDGDYIVAISQNSPFSYNQYCGRAVTITNTGGGDQNNGVGNTITAYVADTCPECDPSHLDLSTGAFSGLTGGNLDPPGEFNIQWNFS